MFSRMRPLGAQSPSAARVGVGAVALTVGLTACGGGGSGEQDNQSGSAAAVRAAYKKTISAETVHVALTGRQQSTQSPSQQQGQRSTLSGQAALDFANDASSTKVNAPGPTGDTETRTIENTLYRKIPKQQRAQVPGKKPWIKINLKTVWQQQYGNRAKQMLDNPPSDPIGMLSYLRGVTKAQESGNAQVRGTQTTHYKAKVDLKQAAKGQGPQVEQRMQQLGKQLGGRPLSIQVWLDGQDRVRRLKTTLPASRGSVVLTEEFYDYGASLQVSPPAEGKTAGVTKQVIQQQKMREKMQQRRQQQQQQRPSQTPKSNQS